MVVIMPTFHQGNKSHTQNGFCLYFTLRILFDQQQFLMTVGQAYRDDQPATWFELLNPEFNKQVHHSGQT